VVGSISIGGNIVAVHLSLRTIPLGTAVEVASGRGVAHIAIAVGGVPVPGRSGVRRIDGIGGSDIGIGVQATVSIAGIIRGITVRSIAVGSVAMRSVTGGSMGSIGRSAAISVGRRHHSLTSGSTYVHLLSLTHAPLILISRASMTVSIGGIVVTISVRGVTISI